MSWGRSHDINKESERMFFTNEEEIEWMNYSLGSFKDKKTLNNQLDLFNQIETLVKSTPNDQELGEKIRKLLNEQNTI